MANFKEITSYLLSKYILTNPKMLEGLFKGLIYCNPQKCPYHDFYGTDFWPFYSQIFLAFLTNKQKIYYSLMGFDTIEINLDWQLISFITFSSLSVIITYLERVVKSRRLHISWRSLLLKLSREEISNPSAISSTILFWLPLTNAISRGLYDIKQTKKQVFIQYGGMIIIKN